MTQDSVHHKINWSDNQNLIYVINNYKSEDKSDYTVYQQKLE